MSAGLVGLVYGSAFVLALLLLYFFRAQHWYWHLLSIALALALGLVQIPTEWHTAALDLATGFAFTFLVIWGLGAPFFRKPHVTRHA